MKKGPALMSLALDVGLRAFSLGVERVEVLFQPLIGGDPRINRAAQAGLCRLAFHDASLADAAKATDSPPFGAPSIKAVAPLTERAPSPSALRLLGLLARLAAVPCF